MPKLYVALVWHQHQPYYKDSYTGNFMLPWTRLHGIKDYNGMANVLREFPDVKATFNFTPVLLRQLEEYYREGITDRSYAVAKKSISELSEEEKGFILDNFFHANKFNMIKPFNRYWELFKKRSVGEKRGSEITDKFTDAELLDLIVLFNLSWIHQTEFDDNEFLTGLKKKGRNFTEEEKNKLLDYEMKILEKVVPLHKELQERKQIEIITSPYYHPILPLLCNFDSAKPGLPDVKLPAEKISLKEDAREQINRGIKYFEKVFGFSPQGFWPSEGAVSMDIVPLLVNAGLAWFATDEALLSNSINKPFRDGKGNVINKMDLYKPYKIICELGELAIVFRDRELSDVIGFSYHEMRGDEAAEDFIRRIESRIDSSTENSLITIILDGENAWESYPENGISFFRALYRRLSDHQEIMTTTISEYIKKFPPQDNLDYLFPGSWIDANFKIWIGHEEDLRGWEYLLRTRKDIFSFFHEKGESVPAELKDKILDILYCAEGSDWYWWFGDDHYSGMDDKYDQLFRQHLKNIYQLMGKLPPDFLDHPIIEFDEKAFFSLPRAFLRIEIDGEISSYYEWFDAGYFSIEKEGGSMEFQNTRIFDSLYFGFDDVNFYLRIDFNHADYYNKEKDKILVHFHAPEKQIIELFFRDDTMVMDIIKKGNRKNTGTGDCLLNRIVEMKISFSELGLKAKDMVLFSVHIKEDNLLKDRIPLTRSLFFEVPDELFEVINWRV